MKAKDPIYKRLKQHSQWPHNSMQQVLLFFSNNLQVRFTLHLAYFLNSIFSQPIIPHRSSNTKCGHCKSESFGCSYSQGALEQNSEHNSIQDKQSSIKRRKLNFFYCCQIKTILRVCQKSTFQCLLQTIFLNY